MPKFPKNTGFRLRSKHGGPFKLMGSSPAKISFDKAFEKRDMDMYGDMDKETYIKEAKRQKQSFEKTGDWDVKGKNKKMETIKIDKIPIKPIETKTEDFKPIEATKTPEQVKDETPTEKPEKKSLWQRYKAHVGSEQYYKNKDMINEAASVIGNKQYPTDSHQQFLNKQQQKQNMDIKKKKFDQSTKLHELKTSDEQVKLDQDAQRAETLASEANTKRKNQLIENYETSKNKEQELDSKDSFAAGTDPNVYEDNIYTQKG